MSLLTKAIDRFGGTKVKIAIGVVLTLLVFGAIWGIRYWGITIGRDEIQDKWDAQVAADLQAELKEKQAQQAFTNLAAAAAAEKEQSRVFATDTARKELENEIENDRAAPCIVSPGRVQKFNAVVRANSRRGAGTGKPDAASARP